MSQCKLIHVDSRPKRRGEDVSVCVTVEVGVFCVMALV